jgi:hypothetical protein
MSAPQWDDIVDRIAVYLIAGIIFATNPQLIALAGCFMR